MPRLAELLWAAPKREALVTDCAQLIERHVAGRKGLKGIGLKTSFALLKSLRPNAVARAVQVLLPEFAEALDPLYQESTRAGRRDFSRFLQQESERAAAALLSVTDARVQRSSNTTLKSVYARMRGSAESEVLAVLPALADLLQSRMG